MAFNERFSSSARNAPLTTLNECRGRVRLCPTNVDDYGDLRVRGSRVDPRGPPRRRNRRRIRAGPRSGPGDSHRRRPTGPPDLCERPCSSRYTGLQRPRIRGSTAWRAAPGGRGVERPVRSSESRRTASGAAGANGGVPPRSHHATRRGAQRQPSSAPRRTASGAAGANGGVPPRSRHATRRGAQCPARYQSSGSVEHDVSGAQPH
jgi:hypothetical protein